MERWGKGEWFEPNPHASRPENTPAPDADDADGWLTDSERSDDAAAARGGEDQQAPPLGHLERDAGPPAGPPGLGASPPESLDAPPDSYFDDTDDTAIPPAFFPPPYSADLSSVDLQSTTPDPGFVNPASFHDPDPRTPLQRIARRSAPLGNAGDTDDPYAAPLSQVTLSPATALSVAGAEGEAVQHFSGSAISSRTRPRAQDRRARALALATAGIAIILACACTAVLLDPALQRNGFPFGLGRQVQTQTVLAASATPGGGTPSATSTTPTATSGSGSGGTPPTPTPLPTGATVSFFVASQHITSSPTTMTACASGCAIPGQTYHNSQPFTSPPTQSTQIPQTQLSGTITAMNNAKTGVWTATDYSFSGHGWTCNPVNVSVPAGTSAHYTCSINASSPQELAAHTISGIVSGTQVTYDNPQPIVGNGGWEVTQSDCDSAEAATQQSQGIPWGRNWLNNQPLPANWMFALASNSGAPYSISNPQCPVTQPIQTFTVTITTNVDDGSFSIPAAQSLAASRLNGQIPAGYVLKPGSASTCTPTSTSYNAGNQTSSLTCADSGLAIYNWTGALKAQLASSLVNQSQSQATATCNQATGVQANSCNVTIAGGSPTMPPTTNDITIDANIP